jgi:hypothetical protein
MYQPILLFSSSVGLIALLVLSWYLVERRLRHLQYTPPIQTSSPSTFPVFCIGINYYASLDFLLRHFFAHHHRIPPAYPLPAGFIAQDCIRLTWTKLRFPVSLAWPFSASISLFNFHSPDKFSKQSIRNTEADSASSFILEAIGSEAGLPAAPQFSTCMRGFRVATPMIAEKSKVFVIPIASMKSLETHPADGDPIRSCKGKQPAIN